MHGQPSSSESGSLSCFFFTSFFPFSPLLLINPFPFADFSVDPRFFFPSMSCCLYGEPVSTVADCATLLRGPVKDAIGIGYSVSIFFRPGDLPKKVAGDMELGLLRLEQDGTQEDIKPGLMSDGELGEVEPALMLDGRSGKSNQH